MKSFQKWFYKNILIRFYLLLFLAILFLFSLWLKLEYRNLQEIDNKLNYIGNLVEQSVQRNDRVLLENIAGFSIKDLRSKAFLLCSNNKILYSLSEEMISCEEISKKNSFFYKLYIKSLNNSQEIKLFVVCQRYVFFYEILIVASFLIFYLFLLLGQLKIINKKIKEDILNPLRFNFSKNSTTVFEIQEILDEREKIKINEMEYKIFELNQKQARQLSHDIRSPLAALRVVKDMGAGEMAPELSKLLGMSIDRITDIANTILPKGEGKSSDTSNIEPCFLWMLLDQIISEKRVEYKNESNISIQFESDQSPFLMNAFCDSTEFMRSVSNMINNSIEARVSNLPIEIKVRLHESGDQIVLSIVDNGKGIPSEVLSKVFDESFSHGKKEGTGLGLYQVKQAIESWGGKIGIESQVNVGTTLTIKLKKSEKPEWLTEPIEIKKYDSIVVLDDEEYVFTILEDRFSEYGKKIEYYKSIMDFESKLGNQSKDTLYLMDHDLKQGVTGLQLIEKHQLQKQAILLTGNYDDKSVQQTAIKINAKILPKPLIHDLPIVG